MKTQRILQTSCFSLALLAAGLVTPSARADVPILPGGPTVNPTLETYNQVGGVAPGAVEIAASTFATLIPSAAGFPLQATVSEEVFRETGGSIDILYQVTNNSTSGANIISFSVTDFAGFNVSVGYTTTPPTGQTIAGTTLIAPTGSASFPNTADRPPAGATITFSFNTPLTPGSTSAIAVVRTNGNGFALSSTTSLNGINSSNGTNTSNVTQSFTPTAIPEPGTVSLVSCFVAVAGLGAWARRRRAQV